MSHTDLAHQYFTSKPNLLRMTTYHRQDMSFTAATFTFSVFSIYTHPHRHIHAHIHVCAHRRTNTDCCAYFSVLYFIYCHMWWCCPPTNTLIIPLKSLNHILYLDQCFSVTMKMCHSTILLQIQFVSVNVNNWNDADHILFFIFHKIKFQVDYQRKYSCF